MKVAIVYDRVNKLGGAERVLLALHEIFPEAPLYTAVYHPEKAKWAKVFPKVIPSFLNKIKFIQDKHEYLAPFMPLVFESFNFDNYDLVISVTSEAAKGIITKPKTKHICYCLTPTRYLWTQYNEYFKGPTFKAISKPLVSHLRNWDKIAAQRPDLMVAISSAVQNRIKEYYGRESEIIYPPVDLDKFKTQNSKLKTTTENSKVGEYFLVVSRLVNYKKVDLAVDAFNLLGRPLKIVGVGSDEARLKRKAKKNIEFLGFVEDQDLAHLYRGAKALIFPGEEDFGIVMVEAQAAGTSVIAYKAGGALDIVVDGKSGIFFDNQNKHDLIWAVKKFEKFNFHKNGIINNTESFSKERFVKKFRQLTEKHSSG